MAGWQQAPSPRADGLRPGGDDGFDGDGVLEGAVRAERREFAAQAFFEGGLPGAEDGGAGVGEGGLQSDELVQGAGEGLVPAGGLDVGERGPGECVVPSFGGVGSGSVFLAVAGADDVGADVLDDVEPCRG